MANYIGVNLSNRVTAALVVDHRIVGETSAFPPANTSTEDFDDALVELLAAAVVLRAGMAAKDTELREFCSAWLTAFKVPRKIVFLE